jgi:5-enolpyruvylshikimate-3-phosphate synthase
VIDILRLMGADISVEGARVSGGEPSADLRIKAAPLRGVAIPEALVPLAIDEFPVLFIAAAAAEGVTELRGAGELRVKETDRLAVMAEGLGRLGVVHELLPDGIRIEGGPMSGGTVDSHGDHRIAMAFAVASLRASGPLEILDVANVATSFPGFVPLARAAGLLIT